MPLSAFYYTFWELLTRLERPIEAVLRTLLPLKCQSGSESEEKYDAIRHFIRIPIILSSEWL